MPAQNLMLASADGRVGWTIMGRIPRRGSVDNPQFPQDWSTAGSARVRPSTGAGASIERFNASIEVKSKCVVRHCSTFTGSKSWPSSINTDLPDRLSRSWVRP